MIVLFLLRRRHRQKWMEGKTPTKDKNSEREWKRRWERVTCDHHHTHTDTHLSNKYEDHSVFMWAAGSVFVFSDSMAMLYAFFFSSSRNSSILYRYTFIKMHMSGDQIYPFHHFHPILNDFEAFLLAGEWKWSNLLYNFKSFCVIYYQTQTFYETAKTNNRRKRNREHWF